MIASSVLCCLCSHKGQHCEDSVILVNGTNIQHVSNVKLDTKGSLLYVAFSHYNGDPLMNHKFISFKCLKCGTLYDVNQSKKKKEFYI